MQNFIKILIAEIKKGLPGTEVQWQMASSDRMIRNFPRTPGKDARAAAVLILLYPHNDSIFTVLMQRHDYIGVHGGQISLPGGKQESQDENLIQTAIRETFEETGADPAEIEVIGTLTPLLIPVSNMIVTPVIGWANKKPEFKHQSEEVVFLFDVDIRRLISQNIVKIKPMEINGEVINVKYFDYDGHVIWGATAMILHELMTIIRSSKFPI